MELKMKFILAKELFYELFFFKHLKLHSMNSFNFILNRIGRSIGKGKIILITDNVTFRLGPNSRINCK